MPQELNLNLVVTIGDHQHCFQIVSCHPKISFYPKIYLCPILIIRVSSWVFLLFFQAKSFYSLNADVLAAMEAANDKTDGRKKKSIPVTPVEVVSNVDRESLLGADEKFEEVDL